jgi:hypothetical protein
VDFKSYIIGDCFHRSTKIASKIPPIVGQSDLIMKPGNGGLKMINYGFTKEIDASFEETLG